MGKTGDCLPEGPSAKPGLAKFLLPPAPRPGNWGSPHSSWQAGGRAGAHAASAASAEPASGPFPGEGSSSSQEDQLCTALVNQLNKFADKETLIQFLRCFLLESNLSSVRWQAHCLTLHIYR